LRRLQAGLAELAYGLPRDRLRDLRDDPLLAAVVSGRQVLDVERSVQGVESPDPGQPLSSLWLTRLR
jgi:hypothetical protein